ncbi:MAG: ATP-binding protein, partial [Methanobacterium sp.]
PPEYQDLDERSLIELKNTGVNKTPFEKEYIRKDGSHIPVIVAGAMLDNERINGVAFVLDITERKKSETELKEYREQLEDLVDARTVELAETYESLKDKENQYLTLFNSIDEGFCTIEVIFDVDDKPVDYRFLEINPAFVGQTGLVEAEGKLMRDLAPDHEKHWFEIYGKIALTGEPMRFVNEAKALNRWYDVYAFKIGDPEGREVAILFNDITKRKKAEDELKEHQDTLEEKVEKRTEDLLKSNKELEQFAYVSSHDLQEPIRMVTNFTQLLERRYKGKLDADADEYINFIVEGAHRMKYLIDDLLAFSRLNTQAKKFENVNLETVLINVLSNLSISIQENNARITHDTLPTVKADESQMMQVLQNLIVNAIKFHGPTPPIINISTQKEENEWIFAVSDNGIGIDPEYQKQIFEVFKRLHTRKDYPGSGIGLSISQKIINRHSGRIWVESELGKGSTFYFTLPSIGGE